MKQSYLIKAIEQNEDVIKVTSLIHPEVEISHSVFQRTTFLLDDLAEAIRENNKDNSRPVQFYITSLKEKRDPRSAHNIDNEKIAVDMQIILPDKNLYKDSKNYKYHLAINLLWMMYLRSRVKNIDEWLIGAGRSTFHLHIGDKHLWGNRSFYELGIKNLIRDAGLENGYSSVKLLEMIPTGSIYTKLIPRIYLKKKLDQSIAEVDVNNTNDFESLYIDPLKEGAEKTMKDIEPISNVLLTLGVALLSMMIFKELYR